MTAVGHFGRNQRDIGSALGGVGAFRAQDGLFPAQKGLILRWEIDQNDQIDYFESLFREFFSHGFLASRILSSLRMLPGTGILLSGKKQLFRWGKCFRKPCPEQKRKGTQGLDMGPFSL